MFPRLRPKPGGRIRIGYVSANFRPHAGAFLIAGLIEQHDRQDFEIVGYAASPDDGSQMRARLASSFDRSVDISGTTDRDAARRVHAEGIDILVDLNGFTQRARTAILAYRPAPIQVNYLGYPATTGADFIIDRQRCLMGGAAAVTCAGTTFAGRVAELVRAIGLPELVTCSLEEYEALALRLSRDGDLLAALRARLARNKWTHPLFDTERFARNIEVAYRRMWERSRAGRPPAAFSAASPADAF